MAGVSVPLIVQFSEQELVLDVEPSEGLSFLKFQLYSVTEIPPDEQELRLGSGELLSEQTDLAHALRPGTRLTVQRRRAAATAAALSQQEQQQKMVAQLVQAQRHAAMAQRVRSHAAEVFKYEDPGMQSKARAVIPLETLQRRAAESVVRATQALQQQCSDEERATHQRTVALSSRDALLMQLLHWFKHEFFTWTDAPKCQFCGASGTRHVGLAPPTAEDTRFGARIVELYQCPACQRATRFPRYNHPGRLMETRTGRCGEWTQGFMLCCRSVGYEVRCVYDWTDHVWAEVWSEKERRWVHCDPCENRRDAPLLYEAGWGKKLSYVLAFSTEQVVDVTRRYTRKWQDVLTRRNECSEEWLAKLVAQLDKEQSSRLSGERKVVLSQRAEAEQRELAATLAEGAAAAESKEVGRTTGALEWRLARGELGPGGVEAIREQEEREKATSAAAASPSPAPAPPAAAPAEIKAGGSAGDPKEMAKRLFQLYFQQLTVGCGRAGCTNAHCASSDRADAANASDRRRAAALALQLLAKHGGALLCEQPSQQKRP